MAVQTHMAWKYRNPADLIGRRCIALTGMDVTLDGPLDLIRLSPVHAVLKYRGIGLHVIDCDLLIIDDLGSEQKIKNVTDEYLLKILDEREKADKPVFVTTNLNEEQLKNSYNERVFSRLFNVNKTIISNIDGNDLRLF